MARCGRCPVGASARPRARQGRVDERGAHRARSSSTSSARCGAPGSTGCPRVPCRGRGEAGGRRDPTRGHVARQPRRPARRRDPDRRAAPRRGSGPAGSARRRRQAPASGPVHLNSATVADLDTLPGVGPVTAQKIVDYRQQHGPFTALEDLDAIPGIGPARIEQLQGAGRAVTVRPHGPALAACCGALLRLRRPRGRIRRVARRRCRSHRRSRDRAGRADPAPPRPLSGACADGMVVGQSLRLEALDRSPLSARVGEAGRAIVVTIAPARVGRFGIRALGRVSQFPRPRAV